MNSILIRLSSPHELICYEAISLAMTLATFDYQVQLLCEASVFGVLMNPHSRIHGMLKSLALYDMPPVWLTDCKQSHWLIHSLNREVSNQLSILNRSDDNPQHNQIINLNEFDTVLNF